MNEKMITVQIEREFNTIDKKWDDRIFVKLFVSLRTSGLLAALGPQNLQSLINLATFMDREGRCYPSLETLAEWLKISVQSACERYKKLCEFRWNGQPIVTRARIRDPKTMEVRGTLYTILTDTLKIFDTDEVKDQDIRNQNSQIPTSSKVDVGSQKLIPNSSLPDVDGLEYNKNQIINNTVVVDERILFKLSENEIIIPTKTVETWKRISKNNVVIIEQAIDLALYRLKTEDIENFGALVTSEIKKLLNTIKLKRKGPSKSRVSNQNKYGDPGVEAYIERLKKAGL